LRLTGGGHRCSGMLEVNWDGKWSRVCQGAVIRAGAGGLCRRLGCGPPTTEPLWLVLTDGKEPHTDPLRCQMLVNAPMGCVWEVANCTEHVALICSEPPNTTPEPPPATSPEPTGMGQPQLLWVPSQGRIPSQSIPAICPCSEPLLWDLGMNGSSRQSHGDSSQLLNALSLRHKGKRRCHEPIPGDGGPQAGGIPSPVSRFQCLPMDLIPLSPAQGSLPKALRRLASGPTPCEGDIEVFHGDQWRVLCHNRTLRAQWGRDLCQELRCGNLSSSTEIRDPPSIGVTCGVPNLHLCPLRNTQSCSRIGVVCQDSKPHPTGTAAGTIASICLALLLFGILTLICGPPAYRRLMKRSSPKSPHSRLFPSSPPVSFHRNSTTMQRPRAEGQRVQGGDNDYAQPPQNSSYSSEYPALERAFRPSNPPDNSSDSDYDLHSARRV
ncbi:CD5 protein, partial [Amazona guildingii]|nr:CD5 protein [Amazona guildingii]